MANIDRADWHYGGQFPAGLPQENGGTHIGMYLAWIINAGLASKELVRHIGKRRQSFDRREITGRDLLFSELDEKFFDSLLTEEGKAFTGAYYESDEYIQDYAALLATNLASAYHVADTWENYDRLAPRLNERLRAWRESTAGG
jgi:hypothetical protein